MQSDISYNNELARDYATIPTFLMELTNRQLLKCEREERAELADMDRMLKEQEGAARKWRHGYNLLITHKWAAKYYALTLAELAKRGYVQNKKGKWVMKPVQVIA